MCRLLPLCAEGICIPVWDSKGFPSYECECQPGYEGDICNISTYTCVCVILSNHFRGLNIRIY